MFARDLIFSSCPNTLYNAECMYNLVYTTRECMFSSFYATLCFPRHSVSVDRIYTTGLLFDRPFLGSVASMFLVVRRATTGKWPAWAKWTRRDAGRQGGGPRPGDSKATKTHRSTPPFISAPSGSGQACGQRLKWPRTTPLDDRCSVLS